MKNSQLVVIEFINLTGLTQNDIALNSGFTPQQITLWKNGTYVISLENYIHLCKSNLVNPDIPLSKAITNESLSRVEQECLKGKNK